MSDLEEKLLKDCDKKPFAWWRYIDDIVMLWQDGEKELEKFLEFLHCYHPTIKRTSNHTRNTKRYFIRFHNWFPKSEKCERYFCKSKSFPSSEK